MKPRNSVRIGVLFAMTCILIAVSPGMSGQVPVGQEHSMHVILIVQKPIGEPVLDLKASDFRVSLRGRKFQVVISQPVSTGRHRNVPTIPTHLLIVFDPRLATTDHSAAELIADLRPLWQHGWQVGVVAPNGLVTPYASSETELLHALNDKQSTLSKATEAAKHLNDFPGRKILLYMSTVGGWEDTKLPVRLKKAAVSSMAQIYIVDGGRPSGSYDYLGPVTQGRGSSLSSLPATTEVGRIPKVSYPAENLFKFGVFHETSLRVALANSVRNSGSYYDLKIICGANDCPDDHAPLSIHIARDGPLRVTADGESEGRPLIFDIITK
jgi:hypothetical protein